MIKFFRHIRQRLLSESKFSKYLPYAIGEIILVVIGILIALQINNWNLERIAQEEELKFIQELGNDLQADSAFFHSRINGLTVQSITLEKLKKLCKGILDETQGSETLELIESPFLRFAMQSNVINEDLDLSKLSEDRIRDLLREYRSAYEYVSISGMQHNAMARNNFNEMSIQNPLLFELDEDSIMLVHFQSYCDIPYIQGKIGLQLRAIDVFTQQIERFTELNAILLEEVGTYIQERS